MTEAAQREITLSNALQAAAEKEEFLRSCLQAAVKNEIALCNSVEAIVKSAEILRLSFGYAKEWSKSSMKWHKQNRTNIQQEFTAGNARMRKQRENYSTLETTAKQWERMFHDALENLNVTNKHIATVEMNREEAEEELKSLRDHLTAKCVRGDEQGFLPMDIHIQKLRLQLDEMEVNQVISEYLVSLSISN